MNWNNITQKQWKEQLQTLLLRSDKALERAIIRIYEAQTDDEQISNKSLHYDNMGFNRVDAEPMTIMAKQLLGGIHLSSRQKYIARKKMPKYWRQLMVISKRVNGYA